MFLTSAGLLHCASLATDRQATICLAASGNRSTASLRYFPVTTCMVLSRQSARRIVCTLQCVQITFGGQSCRALNDADVKILAQSDGEQEAAVEGVLEGRDSGVRRGFHPGT